MNPAVFLLAVVLGMMVGYLMVSLRRPKYLAVAEYWVYLPEARLPEQDALMTRLLRDNPHGSGSKPPIGPAEGLLLSDIRLHVALVLRSKNPHAFRPDLFEHLELDSAQLDALSGSSALAKLRYHSDRPLPDKRHLQFLPHLADSVAELGNGTLIYDQTGARMLWPSDLAAELTEAHDATRPDLHLSAIWIPESEGGHVETRGLEKIGLRELFSPPANADERIIATTVMEEAARAVWANAVLPTSVEVECFGDRFQVLFQPAKDRTRTRIMRIQPI